MAKLDYERLTDFARQSTNSKIALVYQVHFGGRKDYFVYPLVIGGDSRKVADYQAANLPDLIHKKKIDLLRDLGVDEDRKVAAFVSTNAPVLGKTKETGVVVHKMYWQGADVVLKDSGRVVR